jgi:hypothetical protein
LLFFPLISLSRCQGDDRNEHFLHRDASRLEGLEHRTDAQSAPEVFFTNPKEPRTRQFLSRYLASIGTPDYVI